MNWQIQGPAVLSFAVGMLFLYSGGAKLRDFEGFVQGVGEYIALRGLSRTTASACFVCAEIAIGILHFTWTLSLTALLGAVFVSAMLLVATLAISRGTSSPCLCFGSSGDERLGPLTIVRLTLLLVTELVLVGASFPKGLSLQSLGTEELVLSACASALLLLSLRWLFRVVDPLSLRAQCDSRANDIV